MAIDTITRGDKYAKRWTAPVALTGATLLKLYAKRNGVTLTLPCTIAVDDPKSVVHLLDGTLAVGVYQIELEVTTATGDIVTYPSSDSSPAILRVDPDVG